MSRPFLIFFVGLLFVVPIVVLGAERLPLVPCDGPECEACHAITLVQRVINFLVMIASSLAVLLFSYAGFLMVTAGGNEGKIGKGKAIFWNVVVGLVIVLAGWLIVDTFMKFLYKSENYGPWNQIACTQAITSPSSGLPSGSTGSSGGQTGQVSAGQYTHEQARTALGSGIDVRSSGSCSDQNNRSCTSLQGIRQDTINQVLEIQSGCPSCTIVVTGGTETGHSPGAVSHGSGHKIDISTNDTALNTYLESTLTRNGTRDGAHGGPRYRDSCGNEYVRESNHWDISVTNGRCSL